MQSKKQVLFVVVVMMMIIFFFCKELDTLDLKLCVPSAMAYGQSNRHKEKHSFLKQS